MMRLYGTRRRPTTDTATCAYWALRRYRGETAGGANPCGVCERCRACQHERESLQAALRPYTSKEK
jgi:hypothetical protein